MPKLEEESKVPSFNDKSEPEMIYGQRIEMAKTPYGRLVFLQKGDNWSSIQENRPVIYGKHSLEIRLAKGTQVMIGIDEKLRKTKLDEYNFENRSFYLYAFNGNKVHLKENKS